jgi:hypothetical protein
MNYAFSSGQFGKGEVFKSPGWYLGIWLRSANIVDSKSEETILWLSSDIRVFGILTYCRDFVDNLPWNAILL